MKVDTQKAGGGGSCLVGTQSHDVALFYSYTCALHHNTPPRHSYEAFSSTGLPSVKFFIVTIRKQIEGEKPFTSSLKYLPEPIVMKQFYPTEGA